MECKKHVFTPVEKRVFRDIVKTYSTIIENKDTDGATLRTKNEAWIRIATEFNSSPHTTYNKATSKQLRRLWANLKQRQKDYQRRLLSNDPLREMDVYKPIVVKTSFVRTDQSANSGHHFSRRKRYRRLIIENRSDDSSDSPPRSRYSFTPDNASQDRTSPTIPMIPMLLDSNTSKNEKRDEMLDTEHRERMRRLNEKHELEILIMREKLREARAKADLAEAILRKQSNGDSQPQLRNLVQEQS